MNKKNSIGKQIDLAAAKAATLGPVVDSLGPAVVCFHNPDKKNSEKPNAYKKSFVQPAVAPLHDGNNRTVEEPGCEKFLGQPVAGSFGPTDGSLGPAAKEDDNKPTKAMVRKKKQPAEDEKKRTDLGPRPCTLTQIGKFDNAEGPFLLKTSIYRFAPINVIQKSCCHAA